MHVNKTSGTETDYSLTKWFVNTSKLKIDSFAKNNENSPNVDV